MQRTYWKKLDNIWKSMVKTNAGFKCEVCGKDNTQCQLHSHHFIGRTHTSLRWCLANGFCLCASHHTLGRISAHEDPQWFIEEARNLRGDKWYKEIGMIKNQINKFDYEVNKELMDKPLIEFIKKYGIHT